MRRLSMASIVTFLALPCVMFLAVNSPGVSQGILNQSVEAGEFKVDLPYSLTNIAPGHDKIIYAISSDEQRLLAIDGETGRVNAQEKLDKVPVAIATAPGGRKFSDIALICEDRTGKQYLYRFTLSDSRTEFNKGRQYSIPYLFATPAVGFHELNLVKKSELGVVIWEANKDAASDTFVYQLDEEISKVVSLGNRSSIFSGISGDPSILGVDVNSGRVSIIDILSGYSSDTLLDTSIQSSGKGDTVYFAPVSTDKEPAAVVIAEESSSRLTVVDVRKPDISARSISSLLVNLPIHIGLPVGYGSYVTATTDLNLILVSKKNSQILASFRRYKGSLERMLDIPIDFPPKAITILGQSGGNHPPTLVYLSRDGRSLQGENLAYLLYKSRRSDVANNTALEPLGVQLKPVSIDHLTESEVTYLQRSLSGLGYAVGAIDGKPGERTKAALRTFQLDRNIAPTLTLTDETIVALDRELKSLPLELPDDFKKRYVDFVKKSLGHEPTYDLLTLGEEGEDPSSQCFGLNTLPPESLWPNSIRAQRVLFMLQDVGLKFKVTSAYRTPSFEVCRGIDAFSGHTEFAAFDLQPAEQQISKDSGSILFEAVQELVEAGTVTVEMKQFENTLHLAPVPGKWHSVISSYGLNSEGCQQAQEDIVEFSRILAGTIAKGRELSILRSGQEGHYTVTVDTHSNREDAEAISNLIRQLSPQSADEITGRDSFVYGGGGWRSDPVCLQTVVIGDSDDRDLSQFLVLFEDGDGDIRRRARDMLAQYIIEQRNPQIIEEILRNVENESYRVQLGIVVALASVGDMVNFSDLSLRKLKTLGGSTYDRTLQQFVKRVLSAQGEGPL